MAKTPSPSAAKAKPAVVKVAAPALVAVEPPPAEAAAPQVLRFKTLVEEVTRLTGAKPKDAREIVAATLASIGGAIGRGEGLNLPDIGRGRVARSTVDSAGNGVIVLKLRRGEAGKKSGKEALAEPAE
jgi:hypothetical protein